MFILAALNGAELVGGPLLIFGGPFSNPGGANGGPLGPGPIKLGGPPPMVPGGPPLMVPPGGPPPMLPGGPPPMVPGGPPPIAPGGPPPMLAGGPPLMLGGGPPPMLAGGPPPMLPGGPPPMVPGGPIGPPQFVLLKFGGGLNPPGGGFRGGPPLPNKGGGGPPLPPRKGGPVNRTAHVNTIGFLLYTLFY